MGVTWLGEQRHIEEVFDALFWCKSIYSDAYSWTSLEAFRAYEPIAYMHRISPTPLLMTVASNDVVTPGDIAIEAFSRAKEPKELRILEGGHFDPYVGECFKQNSAVQVDFLKRYLC